MFWPCFLATLCAFCDSCYRGNTVTYCELLDKRIPGHGEDVAALQQRNILLDGAPGELLLQIFSAKATAGLVRATSKPCLKASNWTKCAVATHAANPWLVPNFPYDPIKDFKPVSLVAQIPNVLVINAGLASKLGIRSPADFSKFVLAEHAKYGALIKAANIKID